MNNILERGGQFAHAIRQCTFWLLAIEGLIVSLLFLIPTGWALITQLSLIQQQSSSVKCVVTLLCFLAISSICATTSQIGKREWTTVPGTLLLWLAVGGWFLFFLVLNRGVLPSWELPDLILLSSIALSVLLSSLSTIVETLLTKWRQKEGKRKGEFS